MYGQFGLSLRFIFEWVPDLHDVRRFADFVEAHVFASAFMRREVNSATYKPDIAKVPTKSKQSKHLISHDANSKTHPWPFLKAFCVDDVVTTPK